MPIITQADVLSKIIPKREDGTYKAAVPSIEILAYKYSTSIPLPTDRFAKIIEELQKETKDLFALKRPNTPKPPTTNSFSNCNGRWAEYSFAVTAWNKLCEINNTNQSAQTDCTYVYVKLPDYKGPTTKWTNLFSEPLKNEIATFDRDDSDPAVRNAGHRMFTLYASNPDAVILKYTKAELENINLSLSPSSLLTDISVETQEKLDLVFNNLAGSVTPSRNIVAFLSMKTSLRPDRRYQFVREGDNVKAHLMYLHQRRSDHITSFANKFYAVSFTRPSEPDKTITDIASTANVASGLVDPIWSVDKLFTCIKISDCANLIQTVITDNL